MIYLVFGRDVLMDSKTFFDSPIPRFAKEKPFPCANKCQQEELSARDALDYCKNMRATIEMLKYKLNEFENRCISILATRTHYSCMMSGINFLPDSMEL